MKVALLRCSDATDRRETNVTGIYPPLGLAYLGAMLQQEGHEAIILDGEAPRRSISEQLKEIPSDTDIIGITSTTLGWPVARQAAKIVRQQFPLATLVAGGPQVTAFPIESLQHSSFSVGIIGDGEWSLAEVVRRHESGAPLVGIPGTVYRQDDSIEVNPNVHWIKPLDDLPLPALELLPMKHYSSIVVKNPFITMLTSRGCPYKCSFCSQIYTGAHFRSHSAERILAEMERAEKVFSAQEIVLFDETFGANRKITGAVCAGIRSRGLRFRWNARTRIDLLDEDLLREMWGSGCYMLHLGIEAGSEQTLARMQKGITLDQIHRVVHMAHKIGFQLHGYFMLGYPGETRAQIKETVDLSMRLPLNWASYTVTIPNPRTLLQEQAEEAGLLSPSFWPDYVAGRTDGTIPVLSSQDCTASYLRSTKRNAYLRFYLRPETLLKQSGFVLRTGGAKRLAAGALLWLREVL
jgi:anaerobic magnesium-protoporphyrin IX monomethyl ester cyclase